MRRDPTEFRKRFAAWKDGKKPYKAGIPYDDDNHNLEYDHARAAELGYKPDETGHYPTRDYETGRYLKSPAHPTVMKSVVSDLGEGYIPYYNNGQLYSDTWMKPYKKEDVPTPYRYKDGKLPGYRFGTWGDSEQKESVQEWGRDWKTRTTAAGGSKVLQKWNATKVKPKAESSEEYTKRRVAEETKRTLLSDAADIAEGIKDGIIAMHPYTAIPYYGAKVGQDILNRNVGINTALNLAIPMFHLSPQIGNFISTANDAVRNSRILNNNIFTENSKALGAKLGEGSESSVFINSRNSKEVLKVYEGSNIKSKQDAINFSKNFVSHRNIAPQLPIRRYGYVYNNGKYKPVFAQPRLNRVMNEDMPYNSPEWQSALSQIDDLMSRYGFEKSTNGTYTKGVYEVGDVQPGNIGFDSTGNIIPFDFDVQNMMGMSMFNRVPNAYGSKIANLFPAKFDKAKLNAVYRWPNLFGGYRTTLGLIDSRISKPIVDFYKNDVYPRFIDTRGYDENILTDAQKYILGQDGQFVKNLPITFYDMDGITAKGFHHYNDNGIFIRKDGPLDLYSTIIHESDHALRSGLLKTGLEDLSPTEIGALKKAYIFSPEYIKTHPNYEFDWEKAAVNRQVRANIYKDTNLYTDRLDDYIMKLANLGFGNYNNIKSSYFREFLNSGLSPYRQQDALMFVP